MVKSATSGAATAVARAVVIEPQTLIAQQLARAESAESACAQISKLFNVGLTEVALMRVEGDALNFLFPAELKAAGSIPLSSTKAVAARTANTRKVELFNNFVIVQHANVFETIKLTSIGQSNAPGANTIQKLISAPVLDGHHHPIGVLQICHKGLTPDDSGPDFTLNDLCHIEIVARSLAKLPFMRV